MTTVPFDLKPCPFCGGKADLHRLGGPGSTHAWVQCAKCDACLRHKSTFEAAAAQWNQRTDGGAQ